MVTGKLCSRWKRRATTRASRVPVQQRAAVLQPPLLLPLLLVLLRVLLPPRRLLPGAAEPEHSRRAARVHRLADVRAEERALDGRGPAAPGVRAPHPELAADLPLPRVVL